MATPTSKTELLKAQGNELIKSYSVYDGSNRVTDVYVAQADCPNNGSCIRTTYTYDSTSSRVVKRKEAYDTWLSTYDI